MTPVHPNEPSYISDIPLQNINQWFVGQALVAGKFPRVPLFLQPLHGIMCAKPFAAPELDQLAALPGLTSGPADASAVVAKYQFWWWETGRMDEAHNFERCPEEWDSILAFHKAQLVSSAPVTTQMDN